MGKEFLTTLPNSCLDLRFGVAAHHASAHRTDTHARDPAFRINFDDGRTARCALAAAGFEAR